MAPISSGNKNYVKFIANIRSGYGKNPAIEHNNVLVCTENCSKRIFDVHKTLSLLDLRDIGTYSAWREKDLKELELK
jgi:hypothetical protein